MKIDKIKINRTVLIGGVSFILGAAAAAGIAAYLWDRKETQRIEKEIDHLMAIKNDVETFGDPTDDDIDKFTSKHLEGVAYQLDLHHIDGYGVYSRKCAAMIIRRMADCLQDNEIIADFAKKCK